MLKGRKLVASHGALLASERESAKVCRRGAFRYRLRISSLLLTFNEIGNNKFVFPGVTVYISILHFHFALMNFQFFFFFFMERERGFFGISSQFLNRTATSEFRSVQVGFYCFVLLPSQL